MFTSHHVGMPRTDADEAVLQLKLTPDGATRDREIWRELATCPECKLSEYGCICDH